MFKKRRTGVVPAETTRDKLISHTGKIHYKHLISTNYTRPCYRTALLWVGLCYRTALLPVGLCYHTALLRVGLCYRTALLQIPQGYAICRSLLPHGFVTNTAGLRHLQVFVTLNFTEILSTHFVPIHYFDRVFILQIETSHRHSMSVPGWAYRLKTPTVRRISQDLLLRIRNS